jgi:hypothetical protein
MFSNITLLVLKIFVLLNCTTPEYKKEGDSYAKQSDNITVRDNSKICFYENNLQDTLKGKGILRIKFRSKKCNKIKMKEGQLIFLVIETNSTSNKKTLLDYRYLVTDNLKSDEKNMLLDYEKRILSVFKERGFQCIGDTEFLTSDKFDFPFTFRVIPIK